MTIKKLYEWAKENNAENMEIGIQFQDGGGAYDGNTFEYFNWGITAEICHSEYRNEDFVLVQ